MLLVAWVQLRFEETKTDEDEQTKIKQINRATNKKPSTISNLSQLEFEADEDETYCNYSRQTLKQIVRARLGPT